ncbi:hypothetical protein Pint_20503 [Pistacia integerrima]|uniref:Uncharacterized protein n=1 Tax=Pistacia integerrima TaxID=434235 RepID=A0ACC0XE18_9ROSI|nr:hypothetical protein Pint_20503 [Pistacia integerrima]
MSILMAYEGIYGYGALGSPVLGFALQSLGLVVATCTIAWGILPSVFAEVAFATSCWWPTNVYILATQCVKAEAAGSFPPGAGAGGSWQVVIPSKALLEFQPVKGGQVTGGASGMCSTLCMWGHV